jgi:hypothetical protein
MLRFGLALGFLVSYRTLAWAPIFALGANFCLGKMADLDSWLLTNVGTDARRAEVRAVVESLEDLRWLSDDTLSEHLNLEAWAPVSRARFLAAWRELKGEGGPAPVEEAPRPASPPSPGPQPAQEAAPAPAPPAPPAPAPAEEEEAELSDDNAAAPVPKRPRSDSSDDDWSESDGDDDDALARRRRQEENDAALARCLHEAEWHPPSRALPRRCRAAPALMPAW